MKTEDKDRVADDVQRICGDGDEHGSAGIARRTEQGGAAVLDGDEGIAEDGDEIIGEGIRHHFRRDSAEDDVQQRPSQQKQKNGQKHGRRGKGQMQLAAGLIGLFFLPVAYVLGYDDGSAGGHRGEQMQHERVDGVHERDGGQGGRADVGYHHGVDRPHQGHEDLLRDQRKQQFFQILIGKHGM